MRILIFPIAAFSILNPLCGGSPTQADTLGLEAGFHNPSDEYRPMVRSTFVTYSTKYKPGDTVPESGLTGPVTLRFLQALPLSLDKQ